MRDRFGFVYEFRTRILDLERERRKVYVFGAKLGQNQTKIKEKFKRFEFRLLP